MKSLDQFRRLEVCEKVRNVFVINLGLSDHNVLHNIASSSSFFDFSRIGSLLSLVLDVLRAILPFALDGYETGYSQLGATHLVGYLPSNIQRALME